MSLPPLTDPGNGPLARRDEAAPGARDSTGPGVSAPLGDYPGPTAPRSTRSPAPVAADPHHTEEPHDTEEPPAEEPTTEQPGTTPVTAAPSGAALDGGLTQSVLDALTQEIAVIDGRGRIIATNLAWEERSAGDEDPQGSWVDSGPGADYLTLLRAAEETRPAAHEATKVLEWVLEGRLDRFDLEYAAVLEGERRYFEMTLSRLPGGLPGALVTHVDVTWRQSLEHQLAHRATHDSLTGLANRVLLTDRLTQAVLRAQRSARLAAVLVVNLDRFRSVNEALGHRAGDQVLVAVARRLAHACRTSDSVTRFGGDEFVLVAEDIDTVENVRRVATRVLDSLATPVVVDGSELYLGASIGVAVSGRDTPDAAEQAADLLRDAETAMHSAKAAGRGVIAVFEPPMHDDVTSRLARTTALRRAVARGELRLQYQPIFTCRDDGIRGVEALVRWEDPERGVIPPSGFLDLAEDSGVILEIGAWVLDEACRQAALWQSIAPPGFHVHVNLSARQLGDPGAVALVRYALDRHDVMPGQLCLEVSERSLDADPEAAGRALAELAEMGVAVAIDGFGASHSMLASVQRVPLGALKIDRFLTSRLPSDDKTMALVRGIVALAGALGLDTVAQGVETVEQRQAVIDLGCDAYQGYLRARPGAAAVVTALLEDVRSRQGSHLTVVRLGDKD